MKTAFVMIAFNSDYVLEPCLKGIAPYGKIYAAEGPVTYWQERGFTTSTDTTNELLDKYAEKVVHGCWSEKDEEANAARNRRVTLIIYNPAIAALTIVSTMAWPTVFRCNLSEK